jgi:hypothetical protein
LLRRIGSTLISNDMGGKGAADSANGEEADWRASVKPTIHTTQTIQTICPKSKQKHSTNLKSQATAVQACYCHCFRRERRKVREVTYSTLPHKVQAVFRTLSVLCTLTEARLLGYLLEYNMLTRAATSFSTYRSCSQYKAYVQWKKIMEEAC